jgi:L-asparaginase II
MSPVPEVPVTPGPAAPAAVLAEVVRSGFVEGRHRGALVVLGPDGGVEDGLGDIVSPLFPRSSNKPVQAAAMLHAGARLAGEHLALASASHSGEPFHLTGVEEMLSGAGLSPADLRCPPEPPLDREAAEAYRAAGHPPSPLAMNCSGKHAGMLLACVANGWPLETYLDPAHPLQQRIAATLAALTGEEIAHTGVDGCGAPLLAVSLTGLARAFRAIATAGEGTPEARVADAMRAHPEYVAGTRRHDTWLMREVPGALSKNGAEAVQAVALPDGRAFAFKIEDGGQRAMGPVLARVLERLGVGGALPARLADQPLLGGGRPVGRVRAAFWDD